MQSEIDSQINLKQYQSEIAVLRMRFLWLSHAVAKIQLGSELEFVPSAAPRTTPFSDKGRIVAGHRFRSLCPFAPALGAALPNLTPILETSDRSACLQSLFVAGNPVLPGPAKYLSG